MTVYNYENGPCYRCIFPTPPPPEAVTNCNDGGVVGAVTGVIGSLQSLQVLHIITRQALLAQGETRPDRLPQVCAQKMMLFDGLRNTCRTVRLRPRRSTCAVCGDAPTITALQDYEQFCRAGAHDKERALALCTPEERLTCAVRMASVSRWMLAKRTRTTPHPLTFLSSTYAGLQGAFERKAAACPR